MPKKSVLIVGGDSYVGTRLGAHLIQAGYSVLSTTYRRETVNSKRFFLDLATLEGLDAMPACDWTFIAASETRFTECAAAPDRTNEINNVAPVEISRKILSHGGRVFFFSSLAVHDGETDRVGELVEPNPTSLYGEQKRAAEIGLLSLSGEIVILRPSKIVGSDFALFDKWRGKIKLGQEINPFKDMFVAPVPRSLLSDACHKLIESANSGGIYQFSAKRQLSYADIASYIVEKGGYPAKLVKPIYATERLDRETTFLPKFATLGCQRLIDATGISLPSPEETIDLYLSGDRVLESVAA